MAIEKISIDIKSNAKEIENELAQINSQIKALNKKKTTLKLNTQSLDDATEQLAEINKQLAALAAQKTDIKIGTQEITEAEIMLDVLSEKIKQLDGGKIDTEISISINEVDIDLEKVGSELQEQGFKFVKGLAEVVGEGAAALKEVGDKVPDDIESMLPKLAGMAAAIAGMGVLVAVAGKLAADHAAEADAGLKTVSEISKLLGESATALKQVGDKVPTDLSAMATKLASMGIAIVGMGALVAIAGKAASGRTAEAKAGFEAIRDICLLLGEAAEPMRLVGEKVPTGLSAMAAKLASMGIAIVGMGALVAIAGKVAAGRSAEAKVGFQTIREISGLLGEAAESMGQIATKIPSDLGSMGSKLASMGIAIVGMGALVAIAGKLATEFPQEAKAGLSMIVDISILLQEAADTMGQIASKVPAGLESMVSRLASMGIAIVGMGALVAIAGALATSFPEAASAGLSMIIDISILLQEAADTMGQIAAKVPADLGEMASRLASMGIAIVGMGALVAIAGALATSFPEAAAAGLSMIIDISILLQEAADTMGQIAAKVPADLGEMVSRLASMGIAIVGMGALVAIAGALATSFPEAASAGLSMIIDISILLQEAADTMAQIAAKVPADLGEMTSRLASMGIAIVGMGALVAIAGALATSFPEAAEAGLMMILDISILLQEAATTMAQIIEKVPANLGEVVPRLASMGIAIVGMGALVAIAGALANTNAAAAEAGLTMISSIIGLLTDSAEALKQINEKVPANIGDVAAKLASIAIAIGGMGVLVAAVGALTATGVGAMIAGAGLATVHLLAAELVHVSAAIKELDDNVSTDSTGVKEKIDAIVEAIGHFTSANLGSVFDLLGNAVGVLNTAVVAEGISQMVGVGEELERLAEIEVPDNIEEKINSIKEVFGYLEGDGSLLDKAKRFLGSVMDTGTSAMAAEEIGNLVAVAKAVEELEKIEIGNLTDIQTKIESIKEIFEYLPESSGIISQALNGGGIDTAIGEQAAEAIGSLVAVAKSLAELESIEIGDIGALGTKIEEIQSVFEHFEKTKGIKERMAQFFEGGDIDTDLAAKAEAYVGSIAAVARAFEEIQAIELNMDMIKAKIEEIQQSFDIFLTEGQKIKDGMEENKIDTETATAAKDYVTAIATIASEMLKIQEITLSFTMVQEKITAIQDIIKEFDGVDLSFEMDTDALQSSIDKLKLVNDLITQLEDALSFTFDAAKLETFKESMANMVIALQEIMTMDFGGEAGAALTNPEEMLNFVEMQLTIELAIMKLKKINELGTELSNNLQFHFDGEKLGIFEQTVDNMKLAINKILETDFTPTGETPDWDTMKEFVSNAIIKLTEINKLGEQLVTALGFEFGEDPVGKLKGLMDQIVGAVQAIEALDFNKKIPSTDVQVNSETTLTAAKLQEKVVDVKAKIESLRQLIEKVNELATMTIQQDLLTETLRIAGECLNSIKAFAEGLPEISNEKTDLITQSVESIKGLVTKLNELIASFTQVGTNYAQAILNGFTTFDVPGKITTIITTLITTLGSDDMKAKFTGIGNAYGTKLKEGFATGVSNFMSPLTDQLANLNLEGYKLQLYNAGTSLGTSLSDGFKEAVAGMSKSVTDQLNIANNTLNGSGSDNKGPREVATGGLIPGGKAAVGFSSGFFRRRGTDTVPAILTPGEFVQRRAAVNTFGVDFMKRVNNLDIQGAFRSLTNRFGVQGMTPAVSTVINNINHTTNNANRVTQHVVGGNADYIMKRASRYLR
ncbi:hypothetical protein [Enterococcus sp. BWR-S5]|uniref:hypothetical protein n=1 Tax=Enterococcus sp. BWR-S5 TaxID=2787714 RepID=UPI0019211696|nr:hypothetical protein [Enterococcus sp. BWR-S5]MBL1226525.1 hypothetical protein [Enterococcus sp. BWR-S5]